ncbi:MAG TPA: protein kinase [Candidatus Bathyarchaeia archaeon]|nr:protein kinase [Candidatus Bathyarchaeia archaeon]
MESPDRWRRIEELFHKAGDIPVDERAAFLDRECGPDVELRQEVDSLLNSCEQPMDFVPRAVFELAHKMSASGGLEMIAPLLPQPALAAGRQLAHYKVISMLGSGGMGEVYLAEDMVLRRKVALKMLAPELTGDTEGLRRFEQEAYAASALNHPNIVTIYEFGQADGLHFIACEFAEGATLRQKLAHGRLELKLAIEVAIQIASALAAAHARGIVHRDIKPENVIVRNDGIVKVLDFGIAKLTRRRSTSSTRAGVSVAAVLSSETGIVRGTAKYMSPEQARGLDVDARSDIFSLGSVIYELVTGTAAFEGETASDVIAEILKVEPKPPAELAPEVPAEIEEILRKALCKDRDARYQKVEELLHDLQEFKQEAEFQAKLEGPSGGRAAKAASDRLTPAGAVAVRSRQSSLLHDWRLWSVAALLVTMVSIGSWLVRRSREAATARGPRSLAVLPFRNLNGDPKSDFLGFSLADEIITKLDYVNSLTVRPSSSVDKYRDQAVDPKKVAEELNVDTLLTGTFLRDGDDLRITAQLIDVKPDKILWRESMDLKYEKLLTVQDQVAQQIIKQMELSLSPAEAAKLKPEKPINNAAYEDYLRGIDFYALNDYPAAIDMLEKATALEPNYAPAWAHLGRAYTTSGSLQFGGREQYGKAQAAYEKAIALNPAMVEPRIYLANLLTDTGRVEQAVPLLRSVLQDSPNNAEAHWELGYAYRFAGMLKESVDECEKARQYNPQVKLSSSAINALLYLGEYEKFLQSLPVNDSAYILFYRGLTEYYLNQHDQAGRDFDDAYARNPALLPVDVGKAFSYSIRRDNARGVKLLEQIEDKIEERGVSDPEGIYKVAQAYAVLGDKAAALHMLRHSIGGGFFCYPYFVRDPLLQSLRGEPEFQELMEQASHRHEQFKATFF